MSCVVVSGARGLLGATLMRALPDAGFRANPLTCDIRDAAAVTKQIAQAAPVYVVHAAAMTYVAAGMGQPQEAFAVNGEGTKNVVGAARAASARILYISTASSEATMAIAARMMRRNRTMPTTNPNAWANGTHSIMTAASCCGLT